uniref:Transmembrane protein 53 n=1 Tax=Opuntia streptacantha TaxID=393608 RepID=A0A7C9E8I8_OPUST
MEASMRILNPLSLNLNRQLSTTFITKSYCLSPPPKSRNCPLNVSPLLLRRSRNPSSKTLTHAILRSPTCFSPTFSNASGLGIFLSLSSFFPYSEPHYLNNFNHLKVDVGDGRIFHWHQASSDHMAGAGTRQRKCEVAAAVLGWLGARPKHLRRYAELYTSRGIDAITFVVPVRDVMWFDLGRKVESRIRELANELMSWLSKEKDRCLIFHTFSNTGWLVYGAILGHLQERPDLIQRIRGCIVDSGGDPELNPKVWAAGFAAALLKKRSIAIHPLSEAIEPDKDRNQEKPHDKDPLLTEAALLFILEKLFGFLLKLPDVNRRLSRIINFLSENPPPCPQLYLYSTADKVIPFQAVESFI